MLVNVNSHLQFIIFSKYYFNNLRENNIYIFLNSIFKLRFFQFCMCKVGKNIKKRPSWANMVLNTKIKNNKI